MRAEIGGDEIICVNYVRVDTLSCLWKENEIADTKRYRT